MAPFDLRLWENAFQMIPDISFFDVESEQILLCLSPKFGFDALVMSKTYASWPRHIRVLAKRHDVMCPSLRTHVSWLEDMCPG